MESVLPRHSKRDRLLGVTPFSMKLEVFQRLVGVCACSTFKEDQLRGAPIAV